MESHQYPADKEQLIDSHCAPKVKPTEMRDLHYADNEHSGESHLIPDLEPINDENRQYDPRDENMMDAHLVPKIESPENWDPPMLPASGTSSYTSLQPCLQELTIFQHMATDECGTAAQTMNNLPMELDMNNYYCYAANGYYSMAEQASPQDEGIGTPSPISFHSNSPQAPVTEQNPSFGNFFPLTELQNERTSPTDSGCAEESQDVRVVPNTQCVKCGVATGVQWQKNHMGHFLCHSCYLGENMPSLAPHSAKQQDLRKRKKQTVTKKNMHHVCSHCKTEVTSLWRRNHDSQVVCNSCGLYQKLKGIPRPLSMRKDVIQRRKRKPRSSQPKKEQIRTNLRPIITSISSQSMSPTYSGFSTFHNSDMLQQHSVSYELPSPLSINSAIHGNCVSDMVHVMQPRMPVSQIAHRYLPSYGSA